MGKQIRILSIVVISIALLAGCSSANNSPSLTTENIPFDTSHSLPLLWKTVDDPKWGFKISIPRSLQDKGFEKSSIWVHEDDNLRVIVDFGKSPTHKELSQKKNYSQRILQVNNLKSLVCTYEESNSDKGSKKVAALVFLEKREDLGADNEPSFRVEYIKDNELESALKILQTVHFYDS
jgi:hypothetical protein